MKAVSYSRDAARDLRRHANMASRVRAAIDGYARGEGAHQNNVTALVGSDAKRLRVGEYRVIFAETDTGIIVTKIGPRGGVYE